MNCFVSLASRGLHTLLGLKQWLQLHGPTSRQEAVQHDTGNVFQVNLPIPYVYLQSVDDTNCMEYLASSSLEFFRGMKMFTRPFDQIISQTLHQIKHLPKIMCKTLFFFPTYFFVTTKKEFLFGRLFHRLLDLIVSEIWGRVKKIIVKE